MGKCLDDKFCHKKACVYDERTCLEWLGGIELMIRLSAKLMVVTLLLSLVLINGYGLNACFAASAEPVRIGVNIELSEGVAPYGSAVLNGIRIAVQEVNSQGGISGRSVELVVRDNRSNAAYAKTVMKELAEEKAAGIIGCVSDRNLQAAVEWMDESSSQVPVISPTSTNSRITLRPDMRVREFVFRASYSDEYQGSAMAAFASRRLNAKTAAILFDNSSEYSKILAKSFEEQFAKNGGTIMGKEYFLQKDGDFSRILQKVIALKPDVLFVPGYYREAGLIIRQARSVMGYDKPILGCDSWDSSSIVRFAGAINLTNSFYCNHYAIDDPDSQAVQFAQVYRKAYNEEPGVLAALGYDAARLLMDAVGRAKTTNNVQVKEALRNTTHLRLITGDISFDESHDPNKGAVILEFKNGIPVFAERVNSSR